MTTLTITMKYALVTTALVVLIATIVNNVGSYSTPSIAQSSLVSFKSYFRAMKQHDSSPTTTAAANAASRKLQLTCASFDTTLDYHIIARHSGMALHIDRDSIVRGADVEQQPVDMVNIFDDWELVATASSGYYQVVNKNSGMGLNVAGYDTDPGTEIVQWDLEGGANERFCFSDVGGGYYNLIAEHSGLAADIAGASMTANSKLLQYGLVGTQGAANQQFRLVDVNLSPFSCVTIDTTKAYNLVAVHSGKGLAVQDLTEGSNVVQMTTALGGNQAAWTLASVGASGHYHVINAQSGFAMNVAGETTTDGASIVQWTPSNTATNDNWCFQDAGGGAYYIVSEYSGDVIDIAGANLNDGDEALQWPNLGSDNQKFTLVETTASPRNCTSFDTSLEYHLMVRHSEFSLSVEGNSTLNFADIEQSILDPTSPVDRWTLESQADGYYHIVNVNSGKGINVAGEDTEPGANVMQWTPGPGTNDDFCFQSLDNGYYSIIAKHSQLALDVAGASLSEGTSLTQWFLTMAFNQQFSVVPVVSSIAPIGIVTAPPIPALSEAPSGSPTAVASELPSGSPSYSDSPSDTLPSASQGPSAAATSSPSVSQGPSAAGTSPPSVSQGPSAAGTSPPSVTDSSSPSLSAVPSLSPTEVQCASIMSNFTHMVFHITAKHSAKAIHAIGEDLQTVTQQPLSTDFAFDNWELNPSISPGYYRIKNTRGEENVLHVNGDSLDPGTDIIEFWEIDEFEDDSTPVDNWCFVDQGEGFYSIRSELSGLAISVRGGSFANGAPLVQEPYTGLSSQQWMLTFINNPGDQPPPIAPSPIVSLAPIVAPVAPPEPLSGCIELDTNLTYHIRTRTTGRTLYAEGGSLAEGEYLVEAPEGNSKADNWIFQKSDSSDNNYYHIINQNSGHAINGEGFEAENETFFDVLLLQADNVSQQDDWCIEPVGTMGYYRITEVADEEVVTIEVDFLPYKARMDIYLGWSAQQFMIIPINETFTGSQGLWEGPFTIPLVPAAGANLPDGRIVVWAGFYSFGFTQGPDEPRTATAIWDPVTQAFTNLTVDTNHQMFCPGTTVLSDSRVVITGGSDSARVTIYDPRNDTWAAGSEMQIGRGYHAQTMTSDGSIFTVGGSWSGGFGAKFGEVWNSTSDTWEVKTGIPSLPFETNDMEGSYRADNHAWLFEAPNGLIFHAGPSVEMHWVDLSGNGTVTPAGPRADSLDAMNGNAAMYDIGMILTSGGGENYISGPAHRSAYVIDINNPTASVTQTADMAFARAFHNSVVLPDGKVVVVGGMANIFLFVDDSAILTAEMWDPATGLWTPLASMTVPRTYHSIALLSKDGRVIVGGGGLCDDCLTNHPDFEILTPPYLLNDDDTPKVRPIIQSVASTLVYGQSFDVQMDTPGTHTFAMVRTGASTHTVNNDMRRVPCTIVADSGTGVFTLTFPANPAVTSPGVWFLFAMNADGTPSVAESVMIHAL